MTTTAPVLTANFVQFLANSETLAGYDRLTQAFKDIAAFTKLTTVVEKPEHIEQKLAALATIQKHIARCIEAYDYMQGVIERDQLHHEEDSPFLPEETDEDTRAGYHLATVRAAQEAIVTALETLYPSNGGMLKSNDIKATDAFLTALFADPLQQGPDANEFLSRNRTSDAWGGTILTRDSHTPGL